MCNSFEQIAVANTALTDLHAHTLKINELVFVIVIATDAVQGPDSQNIRNNKILLNQI